MSPPTTARPIAAVATALTRLGGEVAERPDGWVIRGGRLRGGMVDASGDHRIAMALRIAGLLARGNVRIDGGETMKVSHPGFDRDLRRLRSGGGR